MKFAVREFGKIRIAELDTEHRGLPLPEAAQAEWATAIDVRDEIDKRTKELKWMDYFRKRDQLYNDNLTSFQPPVGASAKAAAARMARGYRPSAESNLKRSLAQRGIPKGHGAKISATKRAKAMR
jgi:hypothetical protein